MRTTLAALALALAAALVYVYLQGDDNESGPNLAGDLPAIDEFRTDGLEKGSLLIDYPFDETIFPPDFVPPTFHWHDSKEGVECWLVVVTFADGTLRRELTDGPAPRLGEIDEEASGPTNEIWRGTPYQQAAHTWTPSVELWEEVKRRSAEQTATVEIHGVALGDPPRMLSTGSMRFTTSNDPVGAPIFYRDVPLMPAEGETGTIKPLAKDAIPIIAWRLRDVSLPKSKVVLTGMPSCANCHSFSLDGKTLGMDVDGPQGDKGTYAIAPLDTETVIEPEHVITWNSFPDKPEGHKTIGFLTQLSPDGSYAITTLNESLYVSNFSDYRYLQVFYPTRGMLAWYSTATDEMKGLPGADDPEYVHTNGVWTPDGESIVFSRAKAFDPYVPGQVPAKFSGDPNEPRIRYNLYRVPFDAGRGGTPEPIEGASHNGMSNTFPKVTHDGKWIVWTQCRNGQLMRRDGRLWIVPAEGGKAREMRCNLESMNSWHSFSPNSRWMVFSSKHFRPYTQLFLTHIDENGNDSPAVLIPDCTPANRAVNIPEFVNRPYDSFDRIRAPAVNHHLHLSDGITFLEAGDLDEAIAAFERALEQEPDFSRAHANLARALVLKGSVDDAIGHYEKAVEVNPESEPAWVGLAHALRLTGRTDEAMVAIQRALEVSPVSAFVHNEMGLLQKAKGRSDLALASFERAVSLHPEFTEARKSLGFLLLEQRRLDDALQQYRAVVEVTPDDAVAHSSISRILLAQGVPAEALEHLARAVSLAPDDAQSRLALAWQLATSPIGELRDGPRAVTVATEACELTGWRQPGPLDVLAASYAEAGRFEEAVDTARRAERLASEGGGLVGAGLAERIALYEKGRPYRQP